MKTLSANGADVSYFLPHRFDDGYGFTSESLEKIIPECRPSLIITVDCGISGTEAAAAAAAENIDVIITDHHEPGPVIPNVYAVVNPKVDDGGVSDFRLLAGVGIAFKLCHGFIKFGREHGLGGVHTDLKNILDLVALGTVADIVPLMGENRILVNSGLKILGSQVRPGIRALCESAGIKSELAPSHITFNLAPRLNAAGRFGNPGEAFKLLDTGNILDAYRLADVLDAYNRQRKETENEIYKSASLQVEQNMTAPGVLAGAALAAGENWHLGVVGIVASRLAKDYFRPSIELSVNGDTASGSGRSVGDVSLIDLLSTVSEHLIQFGGHPLAAGLTLKTEKIPEFFRSFNMALKEYVSPAAFIPAIDFDDEVRLEELDGAFFEHLEKLKPFGCGNPEPSFRINRLVPSRSASVAEKHTRGVLTSGSYSMDFIAFNRHVSAFQTSGSFDVIASPQINSFRGADTRQLRVIDIRESE